MPDSFYSSFLPEQSIMIFAPAAALCAIIYGLVSIKWIIKQPAGNETMQGIALAIQQGADYR